MELRFVTCLQANEEEEDIICRICRNAEKYSIAQTQENVERRESHNESRICIEYYLGKPVEVERRLGL